MEIESRGRSGDFKFEFENQKNVITNINGLVPIIINVAPITNIPLLLGEFENSGAEPLAYHSLNQVFG